MIQTLQSRQAESCVPSCTNRFATGLARFSFVRAFNRISSTISAAGTSRTFPPMKKDFAGHIWDRRDADGRIGLFSNF